MKTSKLLSTVIMTAIVVGCGPQGSLKQSTSTGDLINGGQNVVDNTATWAQMKAEVDSTAESTQYQGMQMISIDQVHQTLDLTLPLPPIAIMPLSLVAFKELPGTTIHSVTLADGTETWVLSVPLKYILHGAQLNPMGVLPNGDPIPFFPTGEMSGISLTLPQNPQHRITLYIGMGAAAAFIETPELQLPAGFPAIWGVIKNRAKTKQLGFFQLVPNKNSFSSGVYVAAKLPNEITRILGTIVKF